MIFNRCINSLIILLLACNVYAADEVITEFSDETVSVLNEELRKISSNARTNATNSTIINFDSDTITGELPLLNGGTSSALVDPGADRIYLWDDSAGETDWATIGTGLTLSSDLTIDVSLTTDVTLVSTATFTSDNSTTFTGLSGTKNYRLIWEMAGNGAPGSILLQFNADTGANYDYSWFETSISATPAQSDGGATGGTSAIIAPNFGFGEQSTGECMITSTTTNSNISGHSQYTGATSGPVGSKFGITGFYYAGSTLSSIKFYATANNMTGKVSLYELSQ